MQLRNPRPYRAGVGAAGATTHYFFVIKLDPVNPSINHGEPMCDELGRKLVYSDRLVAEREARRRWDKPLLAFVGTGDDTWEPFQQDENRTFAETTDGEN